MEVVSCVIDGFLHHGDALSSWQAREREIFGYDFDQLRVGTKPGLSGAGAISWILRLKEVVDGVSVLGLGDLEG